MTDRPRFVLVLFLVGALLLAACDGGEDPTATPEPSNTPTEAPPTPTQAPTEAPGNIVEEAEAASDFGILLQSLAASGLEETLTGEGPYTVFAPTDDAFNVALDALGMTAEEIMGDTERLTDILLNHVVEGEMMEADIAEMDGEIIATLLDGGEIVISVTGDGVILNNSAAVVMTDVIASNGVIHVIDNVLLVEEELEPTEAPTEEPTTEPTEAPTEEPEEASASASLVSRVCMVTDEGGVDDGTFNQLASDGMLRAAEDYGLETTTIESDTPSDFEPNVNTCLDTGHDVVVTVGFLLGDVTLAAAEANPEVYFIGVDQFFADHPENLVGIQSREDQGGFLAGVLAGLMTESEIVGGVYGIDVPAVVKFRNGFEQGVGYVNEEIETLGVYHDSFQDVAGGATTAEQMIGQGADVIFGAGGPTGSGGIQFAANEGVLVIGVDQDEYLTTFGKGESPGAENLISSALKAIDVGVYDMLNALTVGEIEWQGGGLYNLEVANEGIRLAPPHDADVSDEVLGQLSEVYDLLKSGELETGVDPLTGLLLDALEETEEPEEASASASLVSRVCMVTDEGGVDDGTFNQLASDGMLRAAEDYGLETTTIESDTPSDFEPNVNTCLDTGHDVVVTVGFLLGDVTLAAAEANPEVYFIGVDQFFADHPENLVGIQSREDQGGFLAGVLAGLMTESEIVGGVYGIDVPAVVKFRNGFEQGVGYVNEEIETLGVYHDSFQDVAGGATTAEQMIGQGADVIFGAGGPTGSGGIQFAANEGVLVIGVDQDEYLTTFGKGESPGAENLISSALKAIDVGVYDMLNALTVGEIEWQGGGLYNLEVANEGIRLAPPHDADVSDEVLGQLSEVYDLLKSGELETGVDPLTGLLLDALEETEEPEATDDNSSADAGGAPERACLITDVGILNDGGFNESSYAGLTRAVEEYGIEDTFIETQAPTDYANNIEVCLGDGYDIVITVGFSLAEATREAALNNPEVYFIGVDQDFLAMEPVANLVGLQFREDQGGFLAGAMAALMTEAGTVGGVYGPDIPPVMKFRNGFEQGVAYINPEVTVLGTYAEDFEIPTVGAEIALTMVGEGADVIFGAGGRTGTGAIRAAAVEGAMVIGVDLDQYFTDFDGGEAPGAENIITSAIKRVDNGVFAMVAAAVTGEGFPDNSTFIVEIANEGIELASAHDADVPDEVWEKLDEIYNGLLDGSIETGVDPVLGSLLDSE